MEEWEVDWVVEWMIEEDGKEEREGSRDEIVNERDEWVKNDEWIWF